MMVIGEYMSHTYMDSRKIEKDETRWNKSIFIHWTAKWKYFHHSQIEFLRVSVF